MNERIRGDWEGMFALSGLHIRNTLWTGTQSARRDYNREVMRLQKRSVAEVAFSGSSASNSFF